MTTIAMVWTACGVVCLFIYLLVLSPQRQKMHSVNVKLEKKKENYREAVRISRPEHRKELEKELEALEQKVQDFAIDSENSANLTFAISEIAKANDLRSFSIRSSESDVVGGDKDDDTIKESHIAVSFTGSFQQFARFLNAMERNRPVLFVDNFSIEKGKEHEAGNRVNMDVVGFVRQ